MNIKKLWKLTIAGIVLFGLGILGFNHSTTSTIQISFLFPAEIGFFMMMYAMTRSRVIK